MDVFYNPDGIGDVLLIPIKDGDRYEIEHERFGPITKITSKKVRCLATIYLKLRSILI